MRMLTNPSEWLRCPDCGSDNCDVVVVPHLHRTGEDIYFKCNNCSSQQSL